MFTDYEIGVIKKRMSLEEFKRLDKGTQGLLLAMWEDEARGGDPILTPRDIPKSPMNDGDWERGKRSEPLGNYNS